jgi:hypothetical protein
MYKAGILKSDYLTIDIRSRPQDGDIVVVKLGERFFIRRFYLQEHLIRLVTADEYPSSLVIEDNTPGFQIRFSQLDTRFSLFVICNQIPATRSERRVTSSVLCSVAK